MHGLATIRPGGRRLGGMKQSLGGAYIDSDVCGTSGGSPALNHRCASRKARALVAPIHSNVCANREPPTGIPRNRLAPSGRPSFA